MSAVGEAHRRKRRRVLAHEDSSSTSTSTSRFTTTRTNTNLPDVAADAADVDNDDDNDDDGDDDLLNFQIMSDTHAAIRLLLAEFPGEGGLSPFPVILKHQIYTIIQDRSIVEKQLDQLLQEKIIRRFDSATGRGECFVCLNIDYEKHMEELAAAHSSDPLISSFCALATANKSIDITRMDLESKLETSNIDSLVRFLTSRGYLSMRTQRLNVECYMFSIPCGTLVKNILNGRRELLAILKRKKFRELLQTKLIQLPLKTSCMRTRTVLRDLVGSNTVTKVDTTSGPLVRMRRKRT
jgi:serine/threonine kinase 19